MLPCPTLLKMMIEYNQQTGQMIWKKRRPWMFDANCLGGSDRYASEWNNRHAGREVGAFITRKGYRTLSIRGRSAMAHRVAFAICHGRFPGIVDHENGNRTDNRISNLREASPLENARNTRGRRRRISQYKGVHFVRSTGRWQARYNISGKTKVIGTFDSEEDAARAHDEAIARCYGNFAHLNFSRAGGV